ncbi:MAG TPA: hypothetical protein PLV42_04505 [bacterium]|nr:hypothetical protein [bacterium]
MRIYVLLIVLALLSSISIAYEKAPEEGNMLGINGGYGAYGVLFSPGCSNAWNKYTLFDYYFLNMRYAKRWNDWQIDATTTFYHDIERWHIYVKSDKYDQIEDKAKPVASRNMTTISLSESIFATYIHPNVEISFGLGSTQPLLQRDGGDDASTIDYAIWGSGFWIYPVVALKAGSMDKAYFGAAMNLYDQGMHTFKAWVGGYPHEKVHIFLGSGMVTPNVLNFMGVGNTANVFSGVEGWVHERVLLTGSLSYTFLDTYAHASNGLGANLGVAFTF